MSQVSTEAYDFIFTGRDNLARRIDKMESRIAKNQRKLEKLNSKKDPDLRELGRVEGLLESRLNKLDALQDELIAYNAVPLPEDTFGISNVKVGERVATVDLSITDSPYDDLFDGGDGYRLRVTGEGTNKKGGSYSQTTTLTFKGDDSLIDNASVLTVGGSTLLDIVGSDSVSYTLLSGDGNTVLFELAVDNLA